MIIDFAKHDSIIQDAAMYVKSDIIRSMAFEQIIYGERHCPRCNAIAQLRTHTHESGYVELRLDCPKCKLSKFVKLTTEKFLKLEKKEEKYLKMLQETNSGAQRRRLLKMLEDVRKKKNIAEVHP